ncbi:MAG: putative Ig domain-containing protein [Thermoplasmata archaeon]|nr:putative Ig domain-containing protein [Thermoplasmata archaeon]
MTNTKHALGVALMALLVTAAAFAAVLPGASATGEDLSSEYGEASIIEIAPGYQWRYTPTFPSDLTEYVTISLEVNDSSVGYIDGSMVVVTIPEDAVTGTVYNVVIKAAMTEPVEQTAYQYVQFKVVNGLSVSGTISDIISGTSIDFSPIATSDMGSVTWTVKSGTTLPAGLSLVDGRITGTPTELGEQTVSLTATCNGQSDDLVVTFTVYSKIADTVDETIASYGTTVSSTAIENGSDIAVTWAVTTGTLPEGFTLDASTGVVSGSSTEVQSTTVTITGTATAGPAQSVTKNITVQSEPSLVLSGGESILTYRDNVDARTSTVTVTDSSAITWSVSGYAGVTVSDGVVTVQDPGNSGSWTLTVTAQTAYGQTETVDIALEVEEFLNITGDTALSAIAGTAKTSSAYTITGGSTNTIAASTDVVGLTAEIVDGCLSVQSASPLTDGIVTITVTSAAGQTITLDVAVDVYNVLVFSSVPSGGAVIYAM